MNASLAKLSFLVVDGSAGDRNSEFWRNFGGNNDVDPANIHTEVVPPAPTSCFAEEDGAL